MVCCASIRRVNFHCVPLRSRIFDTALEQNSIMLFVLVHLRKFFLLGECNRNVLEALITQDIIPNDNCVIV